MLLVIQWQCFLCGEKYTATVLWDMQKSRSYSNYVGTLIDKYSNGKINKTKTFFILRDMS